ncbi:hypothetical protein PM082_006266 [Marasmius tenuissimus]|nr:hypothetical protein PM082_006266 [Marasmius tenuissimus]
MVQKLAEDPICMASNQAGSESTISSICAPNKGQKMDMGLGGAERNNPELESCHNNDATSDVRAMEEQFLPPFQPRTQLFMEHSPTIVSILAETSIAVANSSWASECGSLVDRKVLENGLTRFRLREGKGSKLLLLLNWNVEEAWLLQACGVFCGRAISLKEGLEDFELRWHQAQLYGSLNPRTLSERHEQSPIYLFVRLPPPGLLSGDTSSLHYWSCYEDGQSQIPPGSCRNFGLPLELKLLDWFDPTTTNFAQHLQYDHCIFQFDDDSDRFKDVVHEEFHPGRSTIGADSEGQSNPQDDEPVQDASSWGSSQVPTVPCDGANGFTITGDNIASKRQRTDKEPGGIERHHCSSDQDLRHKNDTTSDERATDNRDSRVVQPLPARSLPFAASTALPSLGYAHSHYEYQSQTVVAAHSDIRPFYHEPSSHSANPLSSGVSFDIFHDTMPAHTEVNPSPSSIDPQTSEWLETSESQFATVPVPINSFDASMSVEPYSSAEHVFSNNDRTGNRVESAYTNPTSYAVDTTFNTGGDVGLSSEISPFAPSVNYAGYDSNPYASTPVVTSPSSSTSHANPSYPPYHGVHMPHTYNSGYPPQHWNAQDVYHQPLRHSPSYLLPTIPYPPHPTAYAHAYLPFPAPMPHRHPSTFHYNGGGPQVVPQQQHWSVPDAGSWQYAHDHATEPLPSSQQGQWDNDLADDDGVQGWF